MRLLIAVLLFAVGCTGPTSSGTAEEPKQEVKLVKITAGEIEKMLAAHKGKVVAVDVWADFCIPCKKGFPHLVELHKEFAKDGLVCISVSVDYEDGMPGALKFLKEQQATFPNYILLDNDDNKEELEKTFEHRRLPIIHVFGRDGKRVQMWEGDIKHDEIHKKIAELVKQN